MIIKNGSYLTIGMLVRVTEPVSNMTHTIIPPHKFVIKSVNENGTIDIEDAETDSGIVFQDVPRSVCIW